LLEKLRKKWDYVDSKKENMFNASVVIDSSVMSGFQVPVQTSLIWPTVVEQSIKFPVTHIGNHTIKSLTITNPSDAPLIVQVLSMTSYPQPEGGLDFISDRLVMDSFALDLNGHSTFFLPELENGWKKDKNGIESKLSVTPSTSTLTTLLGPREKRAVQIGFRPDDEQVKTSVMVVRNNLTIIDLVVVGGKGAHPQFRINGKQPSLKTSTLAIDIKPSHLSDCNKSTPKARVYPSFTVKAPFTATNQGQLPIYVVSLNINGYECEGYGFRILNCQPFVLQPNTSKKLDISFTPDFTTSRVMRTLQVVTLMGRTMEFTLLATLPHHLLPLCSSALPRPFWEAYLHATAAVVMSTAFIVVIFFAYFDSRKYVLHCTFSGSARSSLGNSGLKQQDEIYTPGTVFDLNAIAGVKVRLSEKNPRPQQEPVRIPTKQHKPVAPPLPAQCKTQTASTYKPIVNSTTDSVLPNSDDVKTIVESVTKTESVISESHDDNFYSSVIPSVKNSIDEVKPITSAPEKVSVKASLSDSPPATRKGRKKQHQSNENQHSKFLNQFKEPLGTPVIVTEELRDPWERDLIEKVRTDRQKQQAKLETVTQEEEKQILQVKTKKVAKRKELAKENSNDTASTPDDEPSNIPDYEEKLIPMKQSMRHMKKGFSSSTGNGSGSTMDKLDEIHVPKSTNKRETKRMSSQPLPRRKSPTIILPTSTNEVDQSEWQDCPTTPHALAAATVEAALSKSMHGKQKKPKVYQFFQLYLNHIKINLFLLLNQVGDVCYLSVFPTASMLI
jgi:hypothetical protein